MMTVWTVLGILIVLTLIVTVSLLSGRNVHDAKDFLMGGGNTGPWVVCGVIMGSLVSSQATIGTAQLAFNFGLSAWWFTLGSGIGCLILGLVYSNSLRRSGCMTELEIVSKVFGEKAGILGSVLCSMGMLITVIAQVVACSGLLITLFPSISTDVGMWISVLIMGVYVIFGGALGAGMVGIVKLILLYLSCAAGITYVMFHGGISDLFKDLNGLLIGTNLGLIQQGANGLSNITSAQDMAIRFQSLTARGAMKDIGSGISLLLGVLSTQTYAQAILSAGSNKKAKQGAMLCTLLIPILGIAGIGLGLYMRAHFLLQAEVDALLIAGLEVPNLPVIASTIQVFPTFILQFIPSLPAGIILGTLLLASVGGGAGISFGMATILVKNILTNINEKFEQSSFQLKSTRIILIVIFVLSALIASAASANTINDLGFLSMGLRASVVLVPMSVSLWIKAPVNHRCVTAGIILAPTAVCIGKFMNLPVDSLYLGMMVSAGSCFIGYLSGMKEKAKIQTRRCVNDKNIK